jgi:hypothetical protein
MTVAIFCDVEQCSVSRRFEGTYYIYLQGRISAEQETSVQQVARLILDLEYGGDVS